MRQILLIILGLSIVANADFTKSGNIVTDSTTGLQWQDDAVGGTMHWRNAVTHCEELELDGYSDWRLPNINELKTIIDRSKMEHAIVDGFENTSSNGYWSSTTYEGYKGYAWYVYFRSGYTDGNNKDYYSFVRCVRVGQ